MSYLQLQLFRSLSYAIVLVASLVLTAAPRLEAQTAPAATAPLDAALPMSPSVTVGVLDNGLRYYIRENSEPENRAFLRLAIDAGSLLEDDDSLGVAHFLEHMAFNGTERFDKQQIVAFMESIGMRLGPGINAMTSFDETVYMLTLPTDVPERIETAFEILEDWTRSLTLDPDEIEQKRAVVLEEWRGGQGAASRIRDRHLPVLLRGSRYAERLPIGTPDSIRAIDRAQLEKFYRDWYRPDLMAVVAVGDFDAAWIESLIHRHFAELPPSRPEAPQRAAYDVPRHADTLISIAADPEVPVTTVEISHKLPPDEDWTVAGFRQRLVEQLYNNLLNLRLQEITRDPEAPFLGAASQLSRPVRASGMYMLAGAVREEGIERGLAALLAESARIARFGFTETELERGKVAMLREMERRVAARDSRPSPMFAAQYTDAFLTGRPALELEYENALYQRFVSGIELEEVNAVGRRWNEDASRVVTVTAPERDGVELPDEAVLAAVLRDAAEAEVERYVETIGEGILLGEPPAGSQIVATRSRAADVTEWELENGVRVVLKPTDFNQDQVVFRGFKAGGGSLAGDEDIVAVQTAVPVLTAGGLGELDATGLQRTLTGRVAAVNAVITETEIGVAGQASPQDLQTLFELIYLRFTAPRADERAFAAVQGQLRLALGNRDNNPLVALGDAFNRLMTQDHPRARPLTVDMLDRMSLERSHEFYRERFSDATGTTFVFIGAFDLGTMQPLVERYLGGLPASGRAETWRDHGIREPDGVHEEIVYSGREPRSQTRISFHGELDMKDPRERTLFGAMGSLLQAHLRNVLREELGGTYSVSVGSRMRWVPTEGYSMVIEFGSDPARADELVERIFAEIEALRRDGPPADRVADTREGMLRQHETNLRQNGWWLVALGGSYQFESEPGPDSLLEYPGMVAALTPEAIHDGFMRLIDTDNFVRVTLMPER